MFSRRVPADFSANRLSAALATRRASGAALIDLTESNPTRCGFRQDEPALLAALAHPGSLRYEPHPQGLAAARAAVAAYYAEIGVVVDPESLFLTSGTSEAYAHVFKLLADPGDDVLVPTPGYPLLDVLTRLEAVRLVPYALRTDEQGAWSMDIELLRASISTRTKAIVVVSPNNPTGSFLKRAELHELNDLCRTFGCALIVDEVFSDYGRQPDPARVRTAAVNDEALTFCLNGFSKLVGLPQCKLGWIHVSGPRELARQARERLSFVTDAFLSVSAGVQHAAPEIFRARHGVQEQIRRRLDENQSALERALSSVSSCRVLPREGGWYSVIRIAEEIGEEEFVVELLEAEGVVVHPGFFYDFGAGSWLVVSLLLPAGEFTEGVSRLARRLSGTRGPVQARGESGR